MSPDWRGMLGQRSPAEKEAQARYEALLAGMIDGTVALHGLPDHLRRASEAAGMKERSEAQRKTQAWQALAGRTLEDDLLTAQEEEELAAAADALGLDFQSLLDTAPAVTKHLVIAQANDGRLPVLDDPALMAKPGEQVHLEVPAALMKEVTHRELRGGSKGVSVRVAKGVSVRTGAARGRVVVTGTSLEAADEGVLSVTDRRLVFRGARKTQESRYDKLVGLEVFTDGLRVAVSNRQTPSLYSLPDGEVAAAYVNAAVQRGY